ncbi:NAD(P)/FAD-dependent oxidoreductase [Kordiimonas aquimaris]|uniref:NAD(P)/FAD-dependent oxidoreductase n=1 Tax=Kordiimonas aquimaris TaxID=707591 RepID=UPI0021D3D87F|nr:FAD-dependent oxidoreductase [Kordiimonas aquimaris]
MSLMNKKVAIIGAGMTGIACMRSLKAAGAKVSIFEKSRGAGGRMATRRMGNGISADHGAQFFTSRSQEFTNTLNEWIADGLVASWVKSNNEQKFVGSPAMNSPLKFGIPPGKLHSSTHITHLEKVGNKWTLCNGDIQYASYDYVVCTVPAPQVPAIIGTTASELIEQINAVTIAPCWALMLVFNSPLHTDLNYWRDRNDIVSWIGRNSSKPGRDFVQDSWTVHATPEWSAENLELQPEEAVEAVYAAFSRIISIKTQDPIIKTAHRWRYAKTLNPLGEPFLINNDNSLFVGGDWCLGARVEHAFESGRLIAENLIKNHCK